VSARHSEGPPFRIMGIRLRLGLVLGLAAASEWRPGIGGSNGFISNWTKFNRNVAESSVPAVIRLVTNEFNVFLVKKSFYKVWRLALQAEITL